MAVLDSAHTYRADLGTEIAWLYGVARRTISAERRRAYKQYRLTDRVSGRPVEPAVRRSTAGGPPAPVADVTPPNGSPSAPPG